MLNMKIKNREKLSAGFPLINNNNGNDSQHVAYSAPLILK